MLAAVRRDTASALACEPVPDGSSSLVAGPRGAPASPPEGSTPTDVRTVLRTGKSLAGVRVILYVAPDAGGSRAGFVVSRRVGGAVVRNRARRIMRAAWRAVQPAIGKGVAAVFVAPGPVRGARPQDGGTEA